MIDKRQKLPAVALRGLVILPEKVTHFDVTRAKSVIAIEKAMQLNQSVFLVAQKNVETNDPGTQEVFTMGCIAQIKQIVKLPKDVMRILVVGKERASLLELDTEEGYLEATVEVVDDVVEDIDAEEARAEAVADAEEVQAEDVPDAEARLEILANQRRNREVAQARELKQIFNTYMRSMPKSHKEVQKRVDEIKDVYKLLNVVAASCEFEFESVQEILEEYRFQERYDMIVAKITNEIEVNRIRDDIHQKVKANIDKTQKEFLLREQMKVIRQELGEDSSLTDADEFLKTAEELQCSDEIKAKIKKEIKRFKSIQNNSAETAVIRNYIETLLEMPWDKETEDSYDLKYAKQILECEHYGLEEVKERVLEFLAVRALTSKGRSPILCLVGPPGTGKTSIAKSLASAMKKEYVRISLGGIRDEAEIRGHRRTYIGSMPGRIAGGLKQAGTKNPLMLLDEIDKVSSDHKGDTFSALLEVLDSEQNNKFRDHYLEVPVDLSEVLFVATANTLQTIPRPLLDRMEVIEIHSYTENEKVHIAKRHLIPKQLAAHGLNANEITISKAAVGKIARNYTKEAGVRQLERKIGDICRKVAKEILEMKKSKIRITEMNLEKYLGQEKFRYQMKNEKDEVGIVRGLAWTSVGGDTLQIEVNVMPGKGDLSLTGQLGNVMKESAATGLSYIRSVGNEFQIAEDFYKTTDIHVHIPEGAVPKDGPSAGITMATAILSALTGKVVRADIAMTGEITLRGRVLPIGGLKEKLLAAKNAGIKTVLVPAENERDVSKITEEITGDLEIILVSHMSEVCDIVFAK